MGIWRRESEPSRAPEGRAEVKQGRETRDEDRDEAICLPGATDAPNSPRPLAVSALARAPRPAPARAGARQGSALPSRPRAFQGGAVPGRARASERRLSGRRGPTRPRATSVGWEAAGGAGGRHPTATLTLLPRASALVTPDSRARRLRAAYARAAGICARDARSALSTPMLTPSPASARVAWSA